MIDEYSWNFTGTGHETNAETRVKPNPGFHYYENSRTRGERLEDLVGITLADWSAIKANGTQMVFDEPIDAYEP